MCAAALRTMLFGKRSTDASKGLTPLGKLVSARSAAATSANMTLVSAVGISAQGWRVGRSTVRVEIMLRWKVCGWEGAGRCRLARVLQLANQGLVEGCYFRVGSRLPWRRKGR